MPSMKMSLAEQSLMRKRSSLEYVSPDLEARAAPALRIGLISPLFESVPPKLYGGTERVVANLCRGLVESGVDVTLFTSGDSFNARKLIPVIDEALRLRKKPTTDPNAYNLHMLALAAKHASEFDLIHNHHDYWMLPLTEMKDTPVLTTLHGRLDNPELAHAFSGYPEAVFVSISDAQRAYMPRLRWLKTIHHGIDTHKVRYHPDEGKYLAFLGRISKEKRPEWAIQIAKSSGIPLKIAAKIEGATDQAYFDTYIKKHIDGKFIEYVGEVNDEDKFGFLGNALALVFPVDWPEPFGLVCIEALATGTPVLARPCGAVPEILCDQVTGFIHPDISILSRKVRDISSISRRTCRQWVEERFSYKHMIEEYLRVYDSCLREKYVQIA
jgi:glycosyltransferase involved in cell wall biosynthesis